MRERFHVKIARHAEMDLEEIWDYIAADSVGNPQKVQIVHEESIWYGTACASKRVISRNTQSLARPVPYSVSLVDILGKILGTGYRHLIIRKYRVVFRISRDTSTFCESFTEQDCWIPQ